MTSALLTSEEAFKAMIAFLEEYYSRTGSDSIGSLLGSMNLLTDGKPVDLAMWREWSKCVNKILNSDF